MFLSSKRVNILPPLLALTQMSKTAACSVQKLKLANATGKEESLSSKSIEAGEKSSEISHRRKFGFVSPSLPNLDLGKSDNQKQPLDSRVDIPKPLPN